MFIFKTAMTHKYDFLVIGSGIAGMSFALKVAAHGKVAIITKNLLEDGNTFYAQGGIATVSQKRKESRSLHYIIDYPTNNNKIKQEKK